MSSVPSSEAAHCAPQSSGTADQPMGRSRRLALVASLYSTQNLCLAAYNYTFLIAAQHAGASLEVLGAAAGLALIIVLKFLWAPLVDRFGSRRLGHYRGWLVLCHIALTCGSLALTFLSPARNLSVILAVFAVMFIFAGTQDVAADATTTRLLGPSDRGIGNGAQAAGASFAQVVGGGLLLMISGNFGWSTAMVTLALLSALPLLLILRWPENNTSAHLVRPHVTPRAILQFFRRPGVVLWAFVIMPLYVAGGTISYNLLRPMLTQAGWSEEQLAAVVVIGGGIAGTLSGLLGGLFISRMGRRRALLWLGLVQLIGTTATVWLTLTPTSTATAVLVTVLSNAGFAAASAVTLTIAMDLTRLESSGTDFTALSTISGVIMVVAAGSGVALAGTLGFTTISILAAVLAAAGLAITCLTAHRVLRHTAPQIDDDASDNDKENLHGHTVAS